MAFAYLIKIYHADIMIDAATLTGSLCANFGYEAGACSLIMDDLAPLN